MKLIRWKLTALLLVVMLITTLFTVSVASAQDCTWTHRVRFGDTLSVIARQYDTTISNLLLINPQIASANLIVEGADICVSTTATPPPLFGTSYQIRFGDTLATLAQRFGITLVELAQANGIGNASMIFEGETLTVPEVPVVVEPAS